MAYINGHKVISVVRTIYQSELDLVARYHLGVADTLDVTDEFSLFEEDEVDEEVEYGYVEEKEFFHIEQQEDGVFNCTGDGLKRLFDMTDFNSDSGRYRFARQLRSYGLDDALRKLGVQNGDIVRIFDFEFEFID